ncbi:MAG: hypothetical protein HY758_02060 [Nitrospirae bacterium]|nr:hypothetical protein [Nitrospirota bacterium]
MTIKDEIGKEVFAREKIYTVNDLYFKGGKKVPMAEWDVTATEHFGLGLEPLVPDIQTFIVPLPHGTKSVNVEAIVTYEYMRDKIFTLDKITRNVVFE